MEFLKWIFASLVSLAVLFFLTRLLGYRQMSELSMFDYIIGITIGSIAAEMATATSWDKWWGPLIAMLVYGFVSFLISYLTCKSLTLRRGLIGKPLVLYEGGTLYRNSLKKAKLDLSEFLTQCRLNGFFDLAQLEAAVLEPNGRISFLPKAVYRPATPNDLKLVPTPEKPLYHIILDGQVLFRNLASLGKDANWLTCELAAQGIDTPSRVFLATCSEDGTLSVYRQTEEAPRQKLFE